MAASSLLRQEMRRHFLMNVGLVASCVVGGAVVTNERGLFVRINGHGGSETVAAFAAMFTPSHLLPGFSAVQMLAPLEPFDVTADSRDARRRLMEDYEAAFSNPADSQNQGEFAQYGGPSPTLTPQELADSGAAPSASQSKSDSSASSDGGGSGAGNGGAGSGNAGPSGAGSPFKSNMGDLLASNEQTSNSEINSGDTSNATSPVDTGGGGTAPVPEPSVWAMLVAGFGAIGYILRASRSRRLEPRAAA